MAAKQSAEMREALRLVASGLSKTAAAKQAGVGRTSLQAVLAKQRCATGDLMEFTPDQIEKLRKEVMK